ncbi:hypothetical protein EDC96DRAFT_329974 [Choanephora cucurbitarum]|nr:hypothetical protein EDC96DRAFT_329974 [Choanephora cucurbitarum]
MMPLHLIQVLHIWNSLIGVILFSLLIGTAKNIKVFITGGAEIAGFGNFNTFAYPATFVYMFIPVIGSTVYSMILAFDSSPKYKAWLPSKTMRTTIAFFALTNLLAAMFPVIQGADVMSDGSAIECAWTNYMQWKTIYNAPDIFPWVTKMDQACAIFKACDAFCWILSIGWIVQLFLYVRAARNAKFYVSK